MGKQRSNGSSGVPRNLERWFDQAQRPEILEQAESLPLRRDAITLLEYVRDNKVVGTQATGNMPLKAVREVTARFVKPPVLDTTIGDHTYKLRSEEHVWPLYFPRMLLDVGGLLITARSRRWRLTNHGHQFFDAPPLLQVMSLLMVWWYQINWIVAYPYEGMGEALPPLFNIATLAHLQRLPVGEKIDIDGFAGPLIQETGLVWGSGQVEFGDRLLQGSIERMVIAILARFGAATRHYVDEPLGKGTISKLDTFEITPFGKVLLNGLDIMAG